MNPEDWIEVRKIFEEALDLGPGERAQFLDQACAGEPRLRAEVASLFQAQETLGDFIEAPAYEAAADLLLDERPGLSAGQTIGPYVIRHEIGRGGMGIVYLADDTRLSRRVALKAIAPGAAVPTDARERMRLEARAAAALSHPGIATVYALEEIDDQLYLACEYVPGTTLRALVQQGPLPLPQLVDIAAQLVRALMAAHEQGIVHRDLKPENVVRTGAGVVKVLDFGLARTDSDLAPRLTHAGTMVGTPGYMAPEQIRGADVDFRADLFAFGVLLYEMASGSNPFEAVTPAATMARILEEHPVSLSQICSTASSQLDRIVAICLCKNPGDRYSSTRRLVADIERLDNELASAQTVRTEAVLTPRWWWQVHQLIVPAVYLCMLYPAWRVRPWLPSAWGVLLLPSAAGCVAVAATLRLHLWFTARFYPAELAMQRTRTFSWTRWSDVVFSGILLAVSLAIGGAHPEVATLFVAVSIAGAIASLLIEPATTRAAFGEEPAFPKRQSRE